MGNEEITRPVETIIVNFRPKVENFAHVSQRVQKKLSKYKLAQWAYQAFVFINGFLFPAYLFYKDQYIWAFGLFLTTIVIWGVIVPYITVQAGKTYYTDLLGDVGADLSTMKIDETGAMCSRNGNSYFVPWNNMTDIEETDDAIYLYCDYNGLFVVKSGFDSDKAKDEFLHYARTRSSEKRLS